MSAFRFLISALLAVLFSAAIARAEETSSGALAEKVTKAHRSGIAFGNVTLFAPAGGAAHPALLEKESLLQPLASNVSALYEARSEAISLELQTADGMKYRLEMLRSHPLSGEPNVGVIDDNGRHRTGFDPGLHYQGYVAGDIRSMAAMSVFASGEVMLLFANGQGNFVCGRLADGTGRYILYNDRDMKSRPYDPCGVNDKDVMPAPPTASNAKTTRALGCNKVQVYWELAYNVYTNKSSSLTSTQSYAIGLFNQFQAMYYNERIAMELKSLYVWITQDEYPTASSSAGLTSFKSYWNARSNGFDGDLAHLLVQDGNGNGGRGYLDIICSRGTAYSYSDIHGNYQGVPTFSWDVEVITHETGHNLGSNHTHWCGWNTGPGGSCGAIDDCVALEPSSGCTTCPVTNSNSAATSAWQGTVMSYCHLVSRGISLANGFGTIPGNHIRSRIAAATCLKSIINTSLTTTPICDTNGAVRIAFAANDFSTPPYTYSWSNGGRAASIGHLSTAGIYSLRLTDSNGCIANDTVQLLHKPAPGATIQPAIRMPLCCNGSAVPLVLKTGAPTALTACHSVVWLSSPRAFTKFDSARAYFDTTAAANILASASSDTTGATLKIAAPAGCNGISTRYYTPVVMQMAHTPDSFYYSSAANSAFNVGSTRIGSYVTFPDQRALPTLCDLLDTPSRQTFVVSVTGYNGRTGKMQIAVLDASGRVLYQLTGLPGSGSYNLPPNAIEGGMLQAMTIQAFDYNCASGTCTASTAVINAARKVVFGARPATMLAGCTIGASVRVDFAPTGCTKLEAGMPVLNADAPELFPNPATGQATLRFSGSGQISVKVTDMLGRLQSTYSSNYSAGRHEAVMDVRSWPRGVYFVGLSGAGVTATSMKLVVE